MKTYIANCFPADCTVNAFIKDGTWDFMLLKDCFDEDLAFRISSIKLFPELDSDVWAWRGTSNKKLTPAAVYNHLSLGLQVDADQINWNCIWKAKCMPPL